MFQDMLDTGMHISNVNYFNGNEIQLRDRNRSYVLKQTAKRIDGWLDFFVTKITKLYL